jgi:heat shock protein HslJ
MSAARLVAAGTAALLLLAACGEDAPDAGGTATAPPATAEPTPAPTEPPTTTAPPTTAAPVLADALPGRTFLSTEVEGFTLVEGTRIELTFDDGDLAARAGCNHLAGAWALDGDVLVVDGLAQTDMACEPSSLMDQDTWLAAVLTSRPSLALDGDTLTVSAEGATVRLVDREIADPDRPLEGTTWTIDTLVSGDTGVASSVPAGVRTPTLLLADGRVQVDTGCNRGGGDYTVDGDTVTLGPIATTRMACVDEGAAATERHILAVLAGTVQVAIEADRLTLTNGTDGLGARAEDATAGGAATGEGLVGPTWRLESITTGGSTEALPALDRTPTLTFDETTVALDTGCNGGSGSYTVDGDTLAFGPIATTLRLCEDPAGTIETTIVAVLTGTTTFAIDDDGALTLTGGETTLRYVR